MAACKSLSAAPAKKQSPGGRGARHHAWRAPRPAALAAPGGGRIRSSRARPSRLRARAITPFVAGGFAGLAEVRPYTQRRPALAQGVRIGATPLPIGHDAAFVQPGGATTLTRALMTPRAPGPIPVGLWSKMPETAGTPSRERLWPMVGFQRPPWCNSTPQVDFVDAALAVAPWGVRQAAQGRRGSLAGVRRVALCTRQRAGAAPRLGGAPPRPRDRRGTGRARVLGCDPRCFAGGVRGGRGWRGGSGVSGAGA